MNTRTRWAWVGLAAGLAAGVRADYYAAQNGQVPAAPYTNWTTAASNIQLAVNAADAGATVWVGAGTYTGVSQVVSINKSLALKAAATNTAVIVDGRGVARGIKVGLNADALVTIDGFTITNGYLLNDTGAGIQITNAAGGTAVVQNCVIVDNRASATAAGVGGGLYARVPAGVAFLAVVSNCHLVRNYAGASGGGLGFEYVRFLVDGCRITHNQVDAWNPFVEPQTPGANARSGGGISANYAGVGSQIRNSVIERNSASKWGGGILVRYASASLFDCVIRSNYSFHGGGLLITGGAGLDPIVIRNCLFSHNQVTTNNQTSYETAAEGGAIRLGAGTLGACSNVWIESCTIVSNGAYHTSGGLDIYDANSKQISLCNTILYGNWANGNVNSNFDRLADGWTNCLVGTYKALTGAGNITNQAPGFVNADGGNFRLAKGAPAVNAGLNQDWMTNAVDLDGRARIFLQTVDIGAYEYTVPAGTILTIR